MATTGVDTAKLHAFEVLIEPGDHASDPYLSNVLLGRGSGPRLAAGLR